MWRTRRGQERGQFVDAEPELLATTVWSMVHGLATRLVDGQVPIDTADRAAVEPMTRDARELVDRGSERRSYVGGTPTAAEADAGTTPRDTGCVRRQSTWIDADLPIRSLTAR